MRFDLSRWEGLAFQQIKLTTIAKYGVFIEKSKVIEDGKIDLTL